MTVIIKELIVKTTVVEDAHTNPSIDMTGFKNQIVRDCVHKLKKTLKHQNQER